MSLTPRHPRNLPRGLGRGGVCLAATLILGGCAGGAWHGFSREVDPNYMWPPPPETPRVAYVTSIRTHKDLFKTGGLFSGIVRLVAGSHDTPMVRPYAVAVHPAGGLLVTDPGLHVVHYFDWSRREYVKIGAKLKGGLPSPVGVGVLPDGTILVSDSRLDRVEHFGRDGEVLGLFAGKEEGLGRPAGIAVDADRKEVFVADVIRHRIAVFDLTGKLLRTFGERGDGPGQFNFPTHLALTPDGKLAVTDSLNFRVQILNPDGSFVRQFGRLGNAPGEFSKPKGVVVDRDGVAIVVEGLYDSLEFFDSGGRFLLNFGGSGSEPGQFWLPAGLAYDLKDNLLFVADSYNRRVQVFRILAGSAPGLLPSSLGSGEKGRLDSQ